MSSGSITLLTIFILVIVYKLYSYAKNEKITARKHFIDTYEFPIKVKQEILAKYPHLSENEIDKVIRGLREYFHICNLSGDHMIAMPSQVVDVAWHEFILFTLLYKEFCKQAFGRFLHHTPSEAMISPQNAQYGIQRAWRFSCQRININPKSPTTLPILFAIDAELKIDDGFHYTKNCSDTPRKATTGSALIYCATHIGCASGCAGGSDSSGASRSDGGSDGGSSCSSGCGGGCGGD